MSWWSVSLWVFRKCILSRSLDQKWRQSKYTYNNAPLCILIDVGSWLHQIAERKLTHLRDPKDSCASVLWRGFCMELIIVCVKNMLWTSFFGMAKYRTFPTRYRCLALNQNLQTLRERSVISWLGTDAGHDKECGWVSSEWHKGKQKQL